MWPGLVRAISSRVRAGSSRSRGKTPTIGYPRATDDCFMSRNPIQAPPHRSKTRKRSFHLVDLFEDLLIERRRDVEVLDRLLGVVPRERLDIRPQPRDRRDDASHDLVVRHDRNTN